MASEKASVISTLRACILSCKGGVQINALDRDYRSVCGTPIPYRSLGYSTLEAFIRDSPDLYCTKGSRGEMMVHAEMNESSAHIVEMVNKQKQSGKPKARSRAPPPNWASNWSKPKPSWKPPTRYSTPARMPPPPSNNFNAKSPLSITIGVEDAYSRKVVVDKKDYDYDSRSKGIYELPPRFQRTETNMKKGPRFISTQPEAEEDLREKINKLKDRNAPTKNEEKTKSRTEENGVTSKTKTNIEKNQYNETPTPNNTRKPVFSTKAPETNDKKKSPAIVVPRWVRANSQDKEDVNRISFIEQLENYTRARNWPDPCYKILSRVPKGRTALYGCQVKVDDQNYASYPEETSRPEEAKELAAKKAYNKLIEIDLSALSIMSVTDDLNDIYSRVTEIVNQFTGGVWSSEIMKIYASQYNENLPENWLTLVGTCPTLSMTLTIDGRYVLYPDTRESVVDISGAELRLSSCEIDSQTEEESETVPISEQTLPAENCWDVFISYLVSSNTIYLRLIGEEYSDKYAALDNEMELYYSRGFGTVCPLESIEINSYYVGKLDDDWYRVCVLEMQEDGENFHCHLIDIGECETINKSDLYYMEGQFCQLQPQAILCYLAGIDDLEDPELCDRIDKLLLGNSFVATVDERNDEKKEYTLTLYDTSVDPNKNLNETILNLIDSMYQPLNLLKDTGGIKQVYVSHIRENGTLYVQIQSARFDELTKLCEDLDQELILHHRVPSCAFLKKDERYLAKFSVDDNYYRAILTRTPSAEDTEVEMLFIDFGNLEKVAVSDISELKMLSPALYKMHPQAVEVVLHDLKVDETGYKKLKELITETDPVLIKVCKYEEGAGPPAVEVFKRLLQPDGSLQLISIHSTIVYEQSLSKSNLLRKSIRRSEARKEQVSSVQKTVASPPQSPTESPPQRSKSRVLETVHHSLTAPFIPDNTSDFFDVYISLAVSPTNFIVQPLGTVQVLGELTENMTKYYTKHDNEFRVEPEDLVEGGLYAAFDNGEVHRVTLAAKIDKTILSVYACDSGDYRIVDVEDIRYLEQRFTKLPYQAIKAMVHGIKAMDGDWSTENCFYFQRLVVEKKLVSLVKERVPDPLGKHEFVLSLMLIDTNGDDDVNIKQELIKNKIAIPC